MDSLPNKREIIQAILDKEKDLWIIIKPSRFDPRDRDCLCVFQDPAHYKEARVQIPTAWFEDREIERIQEAIRQAIRHAAMGYKH